MAEETIRDLYNKLDKFNEEKSEDKDGEGEGGKKEDGEKKNDDGGFRQNCKFFFQIFFPGVSKKRISKETL